MHLNAKLMDYDGPTVQPEWQDALDDIAPASDRYSTLRLVWEAGDPWYVESDDVVDGWQDGSVHRWVVYQMLPAERTPALALSDLRGPSPRVRGRYDRVLARFIPDPACNVSYRQWLLYQETGRYGVPYWIVQGSRGGHKRRWNRIESVISRMHGGPKEPPLAGDLPYAPFDNRVTDQLAKMDRVRNAAFLLAKAQENPGIWQDHERELLQNLKDEIWDRWLADQVKDTLSEMPRQRMADFVASLPRN